MSRLRAPPRLGKGATVAARVAASEQDQRDVARASDAVGRLLKQIRVDVAYINQQHARAETDAILNNSRRN